MPGEKKVFSSDKGGGIVGGDDGETVTGQPILNEQIQAQLGQQLSIYYNSLISQPIPETFLKLLLQLDKTEVAD